MRLKHLIEQGAEVCLDYVKFSMSYRHDFGKIVDDLWAAYRRPRLGDKWARMLRFYAGLARFVLETAGRAQTAGASAPGVFRGDPRH
jgi:hypothetical protein